jgi:hypothetical protein
MADLYISDTTFSKYVVEYGDDAKDEIRAVIKQNAPDGSNE